MKAVTLIEILVVLVIVGILVTLALPNLTGMKERTLDQEAKANLKLIQAAQKIYRMEEGFYFPRSGSGTTTDINSHLQLFLPTGNSRNWDYESSGGNSFTAKAIRGSTLPSPPPSGWGRTWEIHQNDEPVCSSGRCP